MACPGCDGTHMLLRFSLLADWPKVPFLFGEEKSLADLLKDPWTMQSNYVSLRFYVVGSEVPISMSIHLQ